jgi:hypothetical protein
VSDSTAFKEQTTLPQSSTVPVEILENLFANIETSYKFLFFLALLEALQERGLSGWEDISLRHIAVQMLTLLYVPFKNDLHLANRTKEKDGAVFASMGLQKDVLSQDEVKEIISIRYDPASYDILTFVPYRLIRPFFPEISIPPDKDREELINAQILEKADTHFESRKPLYRIHQDRTMIDVCPDWGYYLLQNFETVRNWVRSKWQSYLQELNPGQQLQSETIFWKDHTPRPRVGIYAEKPSASARVQPREHRHKITESQPLEPAAIFREVKSEGDANEVLSSAISKLLDRLDSLQRPRSLCELRPSDGDLHWLHVWLNSLSTTTLHEWLVTNAFTPLVGLPRHIAKREAVGLMFFLYIAELSRRKGREGEVWTLLKASISDRLANSLFTQDRPNYALLEALCDAAHRFGLRNVFGIAGVQQYYLSIFLQFGMTVRGLQQLGYWLNNPPEAVKHLLEKSGANASADFADLWDSLKQLRSDSGARAAVTNRLRSSAWFSASTVDDIIAAATARPDHTDDGDELISEPRLIWNGVSDPVFQFTINGLTSLYLPDDEYTITSNTITLQRASRRTDAGLFDRLTITLPPDCSNPVLELRDTTGEVASTIAVDLWNEDEEIACFDTSTGRAIDGWGTLDPSRGFILLVKSDLIPPQANTARFHRIDSGRRTLWLVPPGKIAEWKLLLEGEDYWEPELKGTPRPLDMITIEAVDISTIGCGGKMHVKVNGVPEGAKVKRGRIGDLKLTFERYGKGWFGKPEVNVAESITLRGLRVWMQVELDGHTRCISREVNVNISGMMRWQNISWIPVCNQDPLSSRSALESSYRIFLPRAFREREGIALFEGDAFCRYIHDKKEPIGTLSGYGATLYAAQAYTATESVQTYALASEVISRGILERWEIDNNILRLFLSRDIEPSEHHNVYLWCYDDEPALVEQDITYSCSNEWSVTLTPAQQQKAPQAVALTYQHEWIGGYLNNLEQLMKHAQASDLMQTAALLRWWHAPVLSRRARSIVEWANRYPSDFLAAWIDGTGLPPYLVLSDDQSKWLMAVRQIFKGWSPKSAEEALPILDHIKPTGQSCGTSLLKLFRFSPELAASVIRKLQFTPQYRNISKELDTLIQIFLGVNTSSASERRSACERLRMESAKLLNVHEAALQKMTDQYLGAILGEQRLTDANSHNVSSCMRAQSYRTYLSVMSLLQLTRG